MSDRNVYRVVRNTYGTRVHLNLIVKLKRYYSIKRLAKIRIRPWTFTTGTRCTLQIVDIDKNKVKTRAVIPTVRYISDQRIGRVLSVEKRFPYVMRSHEFKNNSAGLSICLVPNHFFNRKGYSS